MKDIIAHWEKIRAHAVDCAMTRDCSVDPTKRELFKRLAVQLEMLASELERVITARVEDG